MFYDKSEYIVSGILWLLFLAMIPFFFGRENADTENECWFELLYSFAIGIEFPDTQESQNWNSTSEYFADEIQISFTAPVLFGPCIFMIYNEWKFFLLGFFSKNDFIFDWESEVWTNEFWYAIHLFTVRKEFQGNSQLNHLIPCFDELKGSCSLFKLQ